MRKLLFILPVYLLLAGCVKPGYKVSTPDGFVPTNYYSYGVAPWVDLGTSGLTIATRYNYYGAPPSPYGIFGSSCPLEGNVNFKNELYVVTKVVKQTATFNMFSAYTGYGPFTINAGTKVSFLWNTDLFYPWIIDFANQGIVDPLMYGDTITVIRIAVNSGDKDFQVPNSKSQYVVIKYDQATNTSETIQQTELPTPVIPAHGLKGVSEKFIYQADGLYSIKFILDSNNQAEDKGKEDTEVETTTVNLTVKQ